MYGPSIMPINGAMNAAADIVLPSKPIIGESGKKRRTVYKAVKHIVKDTVLTVILFPFCICLQFLYHCGSLFQSLWIMFIYFSCLVIVCE
jgi:predicted regulator of amino acid metabolism with ACT domain